MKLSICTPALLAICLLSAGCEQGSDVDSGALQQSGGADLVLYNGKIVTVDSGFSIATAIAISGDRIIAVGRDQDVRALANEDSEVIDLGGRTVIPGLIDSHVHALGYGLHISKHVMFSTGERLNVANMLERIAARAAETPDGEWIYVRGPYSLDFIDEGRLPSREELDSVTPNNPVFINTQGHIGVVNSMALEVAGVTEETPDPPNGVYIRDPASGKLTGTMYEFPTFVPFWKHIPPYSFETRVAAARQANAVFNRLGITTVVNLWAERNNVSVLRHLQDTGELTVRWAMVYRLSPDEFTGKTYTEINSFIQELAATSGPDDAWVSINGVKIIYDGFAEAAYMHEPYLEDKFGGGWRGVAFWDTATLESVMRACLENDVQVFVHVTGDRALDDVLAAMDAVNEIGPIAGRRWTLEHASTEPTDRNLRQVNEMELVISTQQAMGWSIGKTFKKFWGHDRGATFAPNRIWLEAVGHPYVKAGSDNRPIDPFIGIWSYLVREDIDGIVGRPDQVLGLEDTLRLYTANGAYGLFEENSRGSLEAGKLADLVALSDDILDTPVENIRFIKPYMTIVGGQIRYQNENQDP